MLTGKYDLLVEAVGGNLDTDNTDVACECPKCGKNKLYINRDNSLFFCFCCEFSGKAVNLVAEIHGISPMTARQFVGKYTNGYGISSRGELSEKIRRLTDKPIRVKENAEAVKLPAGAVPLRGTQGEHYLKQRGFDRKQVKDYRLLFVPKNPREYNPAANHIVFPCYDRNGVLVFWTSRAAWDPVRYGPKSTGPSGVSKKGVLYGIREFQPNRGDGRMILVEGPLDMLSLDRQGCSLLGKYLSDLQIRGMAKATRSVIVALDSEALGASWSAAARISRQNDHLEVYVGVTAPFKDAAEALKAGTDPVKLIRQSAVRFSEASYMRARTT